MRLILHVRSNKLTMTERPKTAISLRKRPKQIRSNELVSAVLDAAVSLLSEEGALRFTSARVAERAGISVGSIYQYFSNKAAILFKLQTDEWRRSRETRIVILQDLSQPPLDRLRRLVHVFIHSECEEAAIRMALRDAAPLYRDAPEAKVVRASGADAMQAFLAELLPAETDASRALAGELINSTLSQVGKQFSETARSSDEIERFADGLANMLSAYIRDIQGGGEGRDLRVRPHGQ